MLKPSVVRLVKDRFKYRKNKIPFGKNLFVIAFDKDEVLVGHPSSGDTYKVDWKDLKVISYDK